MNKGILSPDMHGTMEPVMSAILIAAPWIFGFSSVGDARWICIVVGIVMLVIGMSTAWKPAIVKLIPLRVHMAGDFVIGAFLILSPFIFGFSGEGGPTRFLIIFGVIGLITAISTRWDPAEVDPDIGQRLSGNP